MFERDLENRLKRIFGFQKVTFSYPSDEFEQDVLFIQIERSNCKVSGNDGGKQTARATGTLVAFSQDKRLPYGFFAKRIENADKSDTSKFFFHSEIDVPASEARLQNIHERQCSFVFLYDSQYNPERGELSSLNLV